MSTENSPSPASSIEDLERRVAELANENHGLHEQVSEAQKLAHQHALEDRERYLVTERFQQTFEFAPIGLAMVGLDGHWIRVNRALAELFGYTPDEFMGQRFQDITHPDDLEADLDLLRKTICGEINRYAMKKRYFRKDGSTIYAALHVALVRDEDGEPVHFISQILDTTAQKHAFDALRASEERLRQLSTPLVPIRDDIVAMPLIGTIDKDRADRVLEVLLPGISGMGIRVAILDVTGVVVVDEQVASALVRAAHAVRLLGAQMVLSGIRADVARTLVEIGADLSGIATCANLQAAIAYALRVGHEGSNKAGKAKVLSS